MTDFNIQFTGHLPCCSSITSQRSPQPIHFAACKITQEIPPETRKKVTLLVKRSKTPQVSPVCRSQCIRGLTTRAVMYKL
jgi:hypothetical protein